MSNGYLVAGAADLAAAHEIAEGFGLDVIDASAVHDLATTGAALAQAANVGFIVSDDSARDAGLVALLQNLAAHPKPVQLILVTPHARGALDFVPAEWPAMSLDEARARSSELLRRRQAEIKPDQDVARAEPLPPASAPEPDAPPVQAEPDVQSPRADEPRDEAPSDDVAQPAPPLEDATPQESIEAKQHDAAPEAVEPAPPPQGEEPVAAAPEPPADVAPPAAIDPPTPPSEAPPAPAPSAPPSVGAPQLPPQAAPPIRERRETSAVGGAAAPSRKPEQSAPADATAFAPGKLRRGTPELVRIVMHQPKDLNAVIKAAKKIDPRTEPAPQSMSIGEVALGANVGVSLEVRGGACDGALQRRPWIGEPIDFNFAVEADANVKQVVMLARVFVDDAQIGVLAFTRKVSGPAKKPHGPGDRARLTRHKRVFLSYSSTDREVVSAIATAYQLAGVDHFWDRTSLKSGDEWHPRLRREIDRADLFHLCWSRAAADSEWVKKEAEHALTRRRKHSGKPEITVQMLDGPPWAPHPPELDAINFDDFVRAAIVGYARGDGSS